MTEIRYLIKRNILIYKRDKAYVFFSVLSMLILLGVMVLFLGKSNVDYLFNRMISYAGENPNLEELERHAKSLVYLWTLAGTITANSITVPFTIYSNMISDENEGKLQAFYTAPVKRWKLTLGYILSSWIIGVAMCMLTLLIGEAYFFISGMPILNVSTIVITSSAIIFNAFVYAVIGYAIALFIKSASAWRGFLTITGTLVGFFGGIYITFGSMGNAIKNIITFLPVIHSTSVVRWTLMESAMESYFKGIDATFVDGFVSQMGIRLSFGEIDFSTCQNIVILICYMTVALVIGVLVTNKRKLR